MLTLFLLLSTTEPDLSRSLSLVGRFSFAHACPVSEHLAITAGHVADEAPFHPEVPLFGARWEDGEGNTGLLVLGEGAGVSRSSDLASLRTTSPFKKPYHLAPIAPKVGEKVWWLQMKWDSKKDLLHREVASAKIINILAGELVVDKAIIPGASGGCVLNKLGEVVGIVSITWPSLEGGGIVGVWGSWLKDEGFQYEEEPAPTPPTP